MPLADLPDFAAFANIQYFGEALADFADTAALIGEMDLVISVDTAVAHLAGAMGKPVWTLLAHAPDWRWMHTRPDTPWYPTMRLWRQSRPGEGASLLAAVGAALAQSAVDRVVPGVVGRRTGLNHRQRRAARGSLTTASPFASQA